MNTWPPSPIPPRHRPVINSSTQTLTAAGAVSLLVDTTFLDAATGALSVTLPDETKKRRVKRIYVPASRLEFATATWTLTGTFTEGFVSLTFTKTGPAAVLEWDGAGWQMIGGNAVKTWENTEQEFTAECPEGETGDPVTVIKVAGTYSSTTSQAAANALALAAATSEATDALVCVPSNEVLLLGHKVPSVVNYGITKIELDGSSLSAIVTGASKGIFAITYSNDGFAYYSGDATTGNGFVRRVRPDGTDAGTLISGTGFWSIAVDDINNNLFLGTFSFSSGLYKSAKDGSGLVRIVNNSDWIFAIGVDASGGKVYWTSDAGRLRRANLDGSSVTNLYTLFATLSFRYPMCLDLSAGLIYLIDGKPPAYGGAGVFIRKMNLDGSGLTNIIQLDTQAVGIEGPLFPIAMALDTANSRLWWTDDLHGEVFRVNTDGTGIELVTVATSNQIRYGIAITT